MRRRWNHKEAKSVKGSDGSVVGAYKRPIVGADVKAGDMLIQHRCFGSYADTVSRKD